MTRMIPYLRDAIAKREPGNIDLAARQKIPTGDGGYATVRSMSFGTDEGEVLVPTAADGQLLSDDEAIDRYYKTGEHLGKFSTPYQATRYADRLHNEQAKRYD